MVRVNGIRSCLRRTAAAATMVASLLAAAPATAETLAIGLSLPLSGTASVLGQQFEQGARLAVQRLARPEAFDDVSLTVVDDGCDEDLAMLAAEDLRDAGVSVVTGLLCNVAVRAAAAALPREIPLIVAGARSERILKDARKEDWNVWRMAPGDDAAAQAAFDALSRRWAGIPWAVIDDGTAYGRTLADRLRVLMEEAGQPPQFADNFRPAQSTQAGLIRRLRRSGVSAAFIAAGAEDVATIWRNRAELAANFEIAGGESLARLPWLSTDGPARSTIYDGLLAVIRPHPGDLPGFTRIADAFADAGIEPESYAIIGFATIELVLAAMQPSPQETRTALLERRFDTVVGAVDFDETGANRFDSYALHVMRGGRFVPLAGPPPGN